MQSFTIKSYLVICFTILYCTNVHSQQLYKISNFMQHSFLTNPAAVGANGHTTFGAAYRSQWSGIDGGPTTAVIFGDTYFSTMNTGLGIVAYSDKTGPTSRTGGELNLSYSIKFDNSNNKRLMIGIGGQFIQFRVDKSKIADALPNDPLLASSGSTFKADANLGIYYRSNTLNMGISAKQLIQSKLDFVKTAGNPDGRLYRHYSGTISYDVKTDEDNILQPNFQIRYQPQAPVDFEGGLILYHKDMFHLGGSYHYKQSYALFAGVKFMHRLSVNYAYEAYNTPISIFASGFSAHEIMLRYFFVK